MNGLHGITPCLTRSKKSLSTQIEREVISLYVSCWPSNGAARSFRIRKTITRGEVSLEYSSRVHQDKRIADKTKGQPNPLLASKLSMQPKGACYKVECDHVCLAARPG
jgi:hypothetical protein